MGKQLLGLISRMGLKGRETAVFVTVEKECFTGESQGRSWLHLPTWQIGKTVSRVYLYYLSYHFEDVQSFILIINSVCAHYKK